MPKSTATTTIVITLDGLMRHLYNHRGTSSLKKAIYYPGCTKEQALEYAPGDYECGFWIADYDDDPQRALRAYHAAVKLLKSAEAEGRVKWAESYKHRSLADFNALLTANGLPVVRTEARRRGHADSLENSFNYSGLDTAVKERKLPYRIIA